MGIADEASGIAATSENEAGRTPDLGLLSARELGLDIVCPTWYSGPQELIKAIPRLAERGVVAIELDVSFPEYFGQRDALAIEGLVAQLGASMVRVDSVHSPFGESYDISSSDDEIHECGVEALIDSIELATVLGAAQVVVHPSDVVAGGRCRRLERARGVLREVGVIAKESGVMLAIENLCPNYLGHSPDEMSELLDGTDGDSVALCFDSGHANMSGRFGEFVDSLVPRAVMMHLHDNDGAEDQHRFPGEGTVDWRRVGDVYRACGCAATIVLECVPPDDMPWTEASRRLMARLGN